MAINGARRNMGLVFSIIDFFKIGRILLFLLLFYETEGFLTLAIP